MKTIRTLIFISLLLTGISSTAQDWTRMANLPQTAFTALEVIDGTIFTASGNTLYYSHDNGEHWQQTTIAPGFMEPGYFKKFGGRLYIGMHGQGIYSAPFDQPDGPWTRNIGTLEVSSFAEYSGSLYASTLGYGIYKLNANQSWSPFMNELPNYSYNVSKVVATTQSLISTAGGNGTFYRYDFTANHWQEDYYGSTYLPGLIIDDALFSGNNLYVANGRRLWRSDDNGNNWVADQVGLPNGLSRLLYQGKRSLYAFTADFNPGNNDNFTYLNKRNINAVDDSWANGSDFLPFYVYAVGESPDKIWVAAHNGLYFKTDATLGADNPAADRPGIVIYPNPSNDGKFTLNGAADSLEVYDASGKLVLAQKQLPDLYGFSVPASGIYIAKAIAGGSVQHIKIISRI